MTGEETMLRLMCDVHRWMTAYVAVVAHPHFSVTGTDGVFDITDVPSGTHRITAWHERFGELARTVRVRADTTTTVTFGYAGSEKPTTGIRDLHVPAVTHIAFQ